MAIPTPEQAQDLVDWAGSQCAVERYTDGLIKQTTISGWLNPERQRANERRYREANPAKRYETGRRYREANAEKIRAYKREYTRERYANDPEYRERHQVRSRFYALANPPMRINY